MLALLVGAVLDKIMGAGFWKRKNLAFMAAFITGAEL